jgi:hypothetical protein
LALRPPFKLYGEFYISIFSQLIRLNLKGEHVSIQHEIRLSAGESIQL